MKQALLYKRQCLFFIVLTNTAGYMGGLDTKKINSGDFYFEFHKHISDFDTINFL